MSTPLILFLIVIVILVIAAAAYFVFQRAIITARGNSVTPHDESSGSDH